MKLRARRRRRRAREEAVEATTVQDVATIVAVGNCMVSIFAVLGAVSSSVSVDVPMMFLYLTFAMSIVNSISAALVPHFGIREHTIIHVVALTSMAAPFLLLEVLR